MRFALTVGLAALAACANGSLVGRQNAQGTTGTGSNATPGSSPSSSSPSSTPTSTPTSTSDQTVVSTITVTGEAASKSTVTTTVGSTKHTTVTATSTVFTTTTVTSSDQETATQTIWETTTVMIEKRALGSFAVAPTPAPAANLAKRATKTEYTTVTVPGSAGGVVTVTVTNNVVVTDVATTTTTSTDTETSQVNAQTTTTVTSTRTVSALVVTSTTSNEEASTSTSTPASGSSGGSSGGGGGSGSGGLSTGAKAGIGAGVGVAGLVVIAGVIFFCCRRRNKSPKPDPDMMAGASEVPIGPSNGASPMSHTNNAYRTAAVHSPAKLAPEGYRGTAMGDGRAGYAKPDYGSSYGPSRSTTTTIPPTRNSGSNGPDALPEHPTPGSENTTMMAAVAHAGSPVSAASPTPSGQASPPRQFTHELGTDNTAAAKWHSDNAAEIDSHQVMTHQSGPIFEMSSDNYR